MSRRRRHLLANPLAEAEPTSSAQPSSWANHLIDLDEEGKSVRLNSDATAAFASLGYFSGEDGH
jgi:hypothetical protein